MELSPIADLEIGGLGNFITDLDNWDLFLLGEIEYRFHGSMLVMAGDFNPSLG